MVVLYIGGSSILGYLYPGLQQYEELFDAAASAVEAVESGKLSSSEAASKILSLFEQPDFVPQMFEFHEASRHYNCNA